MYSRNPEYMTREELELYFIAHETEVEMEGIAKKNEPIARRLSQSLFGVSLGSFTTTLLLLAGHSYGISHLYPWVIGTGAATLLNTVCFISDNRAYSRNSRRIIGLEQSIDQAMGHIEEIAERAADNVLTKYGNLLE